jgi:hypothetical protein
MPDEPLKNGDGATATAEATTNGEQAPPRRRGKDRRPRKKRGAPPAVEEFRARLAAYIADLLGRGGHPHEAAQAIRTAYLQSPLYQREPSAPTVASIIAKARELLREKSGRTRQEHLLDAYGLYQAVIRDPTSSVGQKLQARTRLDALFDLGGAAPEAPGSPEAVQIRELVVRSRLDVDIVRRATKAGVLDRLLTWLTECEKVVEARGKANGQGNAVLGDTIGAD